MSQQRMAHYFVSKVCTCSGKENDKSAATIGESRTRLCRGGHRKHQLQRKWARSTCTRTNLVIASTSNVTMSRRWSSARAVVLYTRPSLFFLHLADSHTTDTYVLRGGRDDVVDINITTCHSQWLVHSQTKSQPTRWRDIRTCKGGSGAKSGGTAQQQQIAFHEATASCSKAVKPLPSHCP